MYVDISGWGVMLIGMAIVFIGLISLIAILYFTSFCYNLLSKKKPQAEEAPVAAAAPQDRAQFVAAVSAAIATEMGGDVSGLRIHSIRKV